MLILRGGKGGDKNSMGKKASSQKKKRKALNKSEKTEPCIRQRQEEQAGRLVGVIRMKGKKP